MIESIVGWEVVLPGWGSGRKVGVAGEFVEGVLVGAVCGAQS
jgi:hypothetical protein